LIGASRVDFVAVPTRDRDRAERFYSETLGLQRNPLSTETWVEFETDNVTLALVEPEKFDILFEPLPFGAIAIRVPDVADARRKLEEAGVEFKGDVWDSGVCNGAAFQDTEGNGLLIHHRYAPYADGREP
jgi:catechol 2,3-dioxygenase-like lactoylglutathione lyase family enzyme